MARMVKLTDDIGERLTKRAAENGNTMAGEIASLLEIATQFDDKFSSVSSRLDKLGVYLKEKFDNIESLLEDTAVDRVETISGGVVRPSNAPLYPRNQKTIPWHDTMRELSNDFSDNLSEAGKWQEEWGNMQDELIYTCVGDTIYFQSPEDSNKYPYMTVTPEMRKYIAEHNLDFPS